MTSLIGYLYRALDEYNNMFNIESKDMTEEVKQQLRVRQDIVREFLDHHFEFNPDLHVAPLNYNTVEQGTKNKFSVNNFRQVIKNTIDTLKDKTPVDNDRIAKLEEIYKNALQDPERRHERYSAFESIAVADSAQPMPSYDVWQKWQVYEKHHYDAIRDLVEASYCEKPEMEYFVCVHDRYPNAEIAQKAAESISTRKSMPVICVENNQNVLLSDFKKNRERIEFYDGNDSLLKKIHDRVKDEQKLAADMIKKKIKRTRMLDIIKHGPRDDKNLNQYIEANDDLKQIDSALSIEEQLELEDVNKKLENGEITVDDLRNDFKANEGPLNGVEVQYLVAGKNPHINKFYTEQHTGEK
jgi:hypothetical protein